MALDWNLTPDLTSEANSLTSLWNGSFLIKRSVDFWSFLISLTATVPGLNLCGFLIPPVLATDFLAAVLLLDFPPTFLDPMFDLYTFLVLAMLIYKIER